MTTRGAFLPGISPLFLFPAILTLRGLLLILVGATRAGSGVILMRSLANPLFDTLTNLFDTSEKWTRVAPRILLSEPRAFV